MMLNKFLEDLETLEQDAEALFHLMAKYAMRNFPEFGYGAIYRVMDNRDATSRVIASFTCWEETEEGYNFWKEICDKLEEKEL